LNSNANNKTTAMLLAWHLRSQTG